MPENSLEQLKQAAEQGEVTAQFNLGLRYARGEGIPKDAAEAVLWFRKAAEQGHAAAQFNLGVRYARGEGVPKDAAEAVRWYRKAAEQGDVRAQFNLGWMYDRGEGVPKDAAEAVRWYRKAAEQGDVRAQFNLGWMYDRGEGVPKDAAEAVRWYRKAAEQCDADAQFNLGVMYARGEGVPKDAAEAVRWFRKAAEQGDADAQFNLGWMYARGEGVPKDAAEAVRWFRKAAEQGHAGAQFNLGWKYDEGEGVPKDAAEAVRWFRKAAEQGHAGAQFNLGAMYDNGEGVPKDAAEAVRWYHKAAEQGHAGAQNNLGVMYENLRVLRWMPNGYLDFCRGLSDSLRALPLVLLALGGGYVIWELTTEVMWFVWYTLGIFMGFLMPFLTVWICDIRAVRWYRKAAKQGYATAQRNLGVMYEKGRGVPKDAAKAERLYREAAKQNLVRAEQNLVSELNPMHELDKLVGLAGVKREVAKRWKRVEYERRSGNFQPGNGYHMIFSGNPGTGKTTVARIIGELYKKAGVLKKGHVIEVKREDLVAKYVGQTAPKTKKKIMESMGGVLFIDEAYTLATGRDSDFGSEAITTLLAEMENHRDQFLVIVAGYPRKMKNFLATNPGLKSRFRAEILFEDYTEKEMAEIFSRMCIEKNFQLDKGAKEILPSAISFLKSRHASPEEFGNARDVRSFFDKIIDCVAERTVDGKVHDKHALHLIKREDIEGAMQEMF